MNQCEGITRKGFQCEDNAIQGQKTCNAHCSQTFTDCGICLETINQKSLYKSLKCKHPFCKRCINTWIIEKYRSENCSCPLCRTPIKTDHVHRMAFNWGYESNYIYHFCTNVYPLDCLDYTEIQFFKKVAADVYRITGITIKENTFRIFSIVATQYNSEIKPILEKMKINSYSIDYYEKTIDKVEKQKSYDMIFTKDHR